jgi:hypothetical protein
MHACMCMHTCEHEGLCMCVRMEGQCEESSKVDSLGQSFLVFLAARCVRLDIPRLAIHTCHIVLVERGIFTDAIDLFCAVSTLGSSPCIHTSTPWNKLA